MLGNLDQPQWTLQGANTAQRVSAVFPFCTPTSIWLFRLEVLLPYAIVSLQEGSKLARPGPVSDHGRIQMLGIGVLVCLSCSYFLLSASFLACVLSFLKRYRKVWSNDTSRLCLVKVSALPTLDAYSVTPVCHQSSHCTQKGMEKARGTNGSRPSTTLD